MKDVDSGGRSLLMCLSKWLECSAWNTENSALDLINSYNQKYTIPFATAIPLPYITSPHRHQVYQHQH